VDRTSPGGVVRVSVHDVGSRVVLRYRLAADDQGPFGETLTDVVGELLDWAEGPGPQGRATVRRRSGEEVVIPLALLVAGKVLPPPVGRDRIHPQDL
jgi:hypothetical protein